MDHNGTPFGFMMIFRMVTKFMQQKIFTRANNLSKATATKQTTNISVATDLFPLTKLDLILIVIFQLQ